MTGRVQGVGFRAFVAGTARAAGVIGAVRNESDGAVTVAAGGEAGALERFAAGLHAGPRFARVDRVVTEELAERPRDERFDLDF